jgi:dihydroflavonol-4-reductase
MKVFVTGATGFVGSHVARVLAGQGADLRLLVRSSSDLRNIQGLEADRVIGDLRDPGSIEKTMAGCDVVFHVAIRFRGWFTPPALRRWDSLLTAVGRMRILRFRSMG